MDKEKIYKCYTKKFFNEEGRFINANGCEWLVLKDMFNWLGKLDKNNQIDHKDRNKLNEFLIDIDKISARESFPITLKGKKQSREVQMIDCIQVDIIPMVLTQFKPTKRVSEEKLNQWRELMKFINEILCELEVYKFITVDKGYQKDCMERLNKLKPDVTQKDYIIVNKDVARIMGNLVGVEFPLYKEQLKLYMNQTTVDLLSVREESLETYLNFYELFKNYKDAYESASKVMKNRYKIND